MSMQSIPSHFLSGGSGLDGLLKKVLDQIRGVKFCGYTAGGTISAGVKGTKTLQDAGPVNALRIDAKIPGEAGNSIWVKTARRVGNFAKSVFDLTIYYPSDWTGQVFTVTNATDTLNIAAHGHETGDGPFRLTGSDLGLNLLTTALYWVIKTGAGTLKLATSKANAIAGTAVAIDDDGSGTQTMFAMGVEEFSGLSMDDADPMFVEGVVNSGANGQGPSKWVTATDLDSVTADQRPSDQGPVVLASGAGEVAVTGVERGDHIVALNLTTNVFPSAGSGAFEATSPGKAVLASGTFVTANTNLVLMLVFPAQ